MEETKNPDTASYSTFNDFFLRQLKDNVRPIDIDPNIIVMPVDGMINQLGKIKENKIFQAKKFDYSLKALLANNDILANQFRNGIFINIYLSPKDYHRVHMPCNGILKEIIYVPGDLFSVNFLTTNRIPNLFTRNERVICIFDTKFGPMAQILIGAIIVGSIEIVLFDTIMIPRESTIKYWTWPMDNNKKEPITFLKGQEMGRFKLGSTVINLFVPNKVKLFETLESLSPIKIGQPLAISNEMIICKKNKISD